jgi:hypothetical protein
MTLEVWQPASHAGGECSCVPADCKFDSGPTAAASPHSLTHLLLLLLGLSSYNIPNIRSLHIVVAQDGNAPYNPATMKLLRKLTVILSALCCVNFSVAKEDAKPKKEKVPSGYFGWDELDKAKEKAKSTKKLIAVLAKGENDACPHCVAAMSSGSSALRGDCVMVFVRSPGLAAKVAAESPAVKSGLSGCPTGASVTVVVFDPEFKEVVAKLGRDELENDRKAVSEMKKTVKAAAKKYFPG